MGTWISTSGTAGRTRTRTGEVTRYLGRYGCAWVAECVLVSPIAPYLVQTPDNPDGLPQGLFDAFVQAAQADTRPG